MRGKSTVIIVYRLFDEIIELLQYTLLVKLFKLQVGRRKEGLACRFLISLLILVNELNILVVESNLLESMNLSTN